MLRQKSCQIICVGGRTIGFGHIQYVLTQAHKCPLTQYLQKSSRGGTAKRTRFLPGLKSQVSAM
jgi:hypothetical protein